MHPGNFFRPSCVLFSDDQKLTARQFSQEAKCGHDRFIRVRRGFGWNNKGSKAREKGLFLTGFHSADSFLQKLKKALQIVSLLNWGDRGGVKFFKEVRREFNLESRIFFFSVEAPSRFDMFQNIVLYKHSCHEVKLLWRSIKIRGRKYMSMWQN